jgi:chemosensory pili system protein ChpA (sensor histidine kinase/response regulator)
MSRPLAMIAEDDPKLGMIYEMALHQVGYATYLDKDGDQIVDALPGLDPALIILDMHLPFVSGAELLDQIRADGRWANVPIILATADLQAAKSLQGKADYVLAKPVSVGRLLEIISQLQGKNGLANESV